MSTDSKAVDSLNASWDEGHSFVQALRVMPPVYECGGRFMTRDGISPREWMMAEAQKQATTDAQNADERRIKEPDFLARLESQRVSLERMQSVLDEIHFAEIERQMG